MPNKQIPPLSFKTTSKISRLLRGEIQDQRELFGQVMEMRIVDTRYFGILQHNGKTIKCSYTEDLDDDVLNSLGKEVLLFKLAMYRQFTIKNGSKHDRIYVKLEVT